MYMRMLITVRFPLLETVELHKNDTRFCTQKKRRGEITTQMVRFLFTLNECVLIHNEVTSGQVQQGLNSLVTLGAWTLWKHRNLFFDCVVPNLSGRGVIWCLAGG